MEVNDFRLEQRRIKQRTTRSFDRMKEYRSLDERVQRIWTELYKE